MNVGKTIDNLFKKRIATKLHNINITDVVSYDRLIINEINGFKKVYETVVQLEIKDEHLKQIMLSTYNSSMTKYMSSKKYERGVDIVQDNFVDHIAHQLVISIDKLMTMTKYNKRFASFKKLLLNSSEIKIGNWEIKKETIDEIRHGFDLLKSCGLRISQVNGVVDSQYVLLKGI